MERQTPWYIAIGASGGDGLTDILTLLVSLPAPLRAVVLVVLHRPWDTPTNLAAILRRSCQHPVRIAEQGERLEVGCVYIGEPEHHLRLMAGNFGEVVDDPAKRHRNRTVDLLFRSVALHAQRHAIGVVLSGSLDDGSRGLAAIHHAGGLTMVLLPSGLNRGGMPENAIAFDGAVDVIGSPKEIAGAIRLRLASPLDAPETRPGLNSRLIAK